MPGVGRNHDLSPLPLQPCPPPCQIPNLTGARTREKGEAPRKQQLKEGAIQREKLAPFSEFWQSVWDGNGRCHPGPEAWLLGPLEEGALGVGETSLAEKGPGWGWQGHCLPGWTIAHCPAQTSSRNQPPFSFLGGSFFFFFRLLTEKNFKKQKTKKRKKEKKSWYMK